MEIAALTPIGKVDLGNGGSIELSLENGLDSGKGVEPCGEFFGSFAFEKAKIELVPDVDREMGDFTVASGHGVWGFWFCGDLKVYGVAVAPAGSALTTVFEPPFVSGPPPAT